jgi:hypothetical protein
MAVILKENTLAGEELADLLIHHYELFTDAVASQRMEAGDSAELDWSVIALRQTKTG